MKRLPKQKVPDNKKDKAWIAETVDYYIDACKSANPNKHLTKIYLDAVNGIIDEDAYKYVLNPLNSDNERLKNYPGDLRNYDIINPIVRRYLGEYMKIPDRFMVTCTNSDVTNIKKLKLQEEGEKMIRENLALYLTQSGFGSEKLSEEELQEKEHDIQKKIAEISESWEDERAIVGQEALNVIKDNTKHLLMYAQAYFYWIVTGEVYSYRDVRNNDIFKEVISPLEMYPLINREDFIEDTPHQTRVFQVTIEEYRAYLEHKFSKEDQKIIEDMYERHQRGDGSAFISADMTYVKSLLGDAYWSFILNRNNNQAEQAVIFSNNPHLLDVEHVVMTIPKQVKIVTYTDPMTGKVEQKEVPSNYKEQDGDLDIYIDYIQERVECYRIGGDDGFSVYSELEPLLVQRDSMNNINVTKSCYNGKKYILHNWNNHSIVKSILPYQHFINILHLQRERAIATNVGKILVIPKGLMVNDKDMSHEDVLYYIKADKKLYVNEKAAGFAASINGVKVVDASDHEFIRALTDIIANTKEEAWESIDMNAQRYGDIQTSAGKSVTQEAIGRVSTGSIPINEIFYYFMETDLQADLDYAKVAWIDGKKGSYVNSENRKVYYEINGTDFMESELGVHVVSDAMESEKMRLARDFAHAAAQNQQFSMAISALEADNMAKLGKLVKEYEDAMKKHEMDKEREKTKQVQAATESAEKLQVIKFNLDKYKIDMDYKKVIDGKILDLQKEGKSVGLEIEQPDVPDMDELNLEERKVKVQEKKNDIAEKKIKSDEKIARMNKN